MKYSSSDMLNRSAVYLYSVAENGEPFTASGFYYQSDDASPVFIVSNRHVFSEKKLITIPFYPSSGDRAVYGVIIPNNGSLFFHPVVDLALLLVSDVDFSDPQSSMLDVSFTCISRNMILEKRSMESLDYMEPVVMFGSPDGIFDVDHSLSVAQSGVTATHPGRPILDGTFLVDIASNDGSSGSPVFRATPENMISFADTELLGILSKTHRNKHTDQPMHFAHVIPAYYLLDFDEVIKQVSRSLSLP